MNIENIKDWLKSHKILVLILIIAAAFRFFNIDFQSVWLDEIHTLRESNPAKSFGEMYSELLSGEPHPPLYFAIIHVLFQLFGYTSAVMRVFSALIGVLGILGIYALGKELFSRRAGMISAILLAVNGYHIYYSQEGRMYSLLLLTTTVAFFFLVRFLRNLNTKGAILYGVSAGLMISVHFFGLLTLVSQMVIVAVVFFGSERERRKKLVSLGLLAAVVVFVFFLPSLQLLLRSAAMTETWIPKPTQDAYTLLFREFFSNFEMLTVLAGIVILSYFLSVFAFSTKDRDQAFSIDDKRTFSFLVLIIWIVTVLVLAIVKSYLSLPVIISRYFIGLLPPLLVLMAIGISEYRNNAIRYAVIVLYVVLSVSDLLFIRNYYFQPTKSQFREATNFVIAKNPKKHVVVSDLSLYLDYFLKNDKVNFELVGSSIDDYVVQMEQDSTKIQPFWFVNAHGKQYTPNDHTKAFIERHFFIEDNFQGWDAWAKHFILLKDAVRTVDIKHFGKLTAANGDPLGYNIDIFEDKAPNLKISGWACFPDQDAVSSTIKLLAIKDNVAHVLQTERVLRPDVTKAAKNKYNMDDCGFSVDMDFNNFPAGQYRLGIYVFDSTSHKEALILTDHLLTSVKKEIE